MNLDRLLRPTSLDEFYGLGKIKRDVESLLKTGDLPHLMFVGPPGCGKTSLALYIASHFLGKKIKINTRVAAENFMVLNASSERGIDVVREVIESFVKQKPIDVPFSFILLDEVDSSTPEFQHALRPTMEAYEDRCKFILCLNRIEGISEPALISRCATFFFKRPNKKDCVDFILKTCEKLGINLKEPKKMAEDIADYYKGDFRHILNDCIEILRGYEEVITEDHLWKIYEMADKTVAERVFNSDNPRETFFKIYRTEAFDTRKFLEDYYELLEDTSTQVARIFAKVDARLRMYASEVVQINYLFSALEWHDKMKGDTNEVRDKPQRYF